MSTNDENWNKLWEKLDSTDRKVEDLGSKISSLELKFTASLAAQERRHQEDIKDIRKDIEFIKNDLKKELAEAKNKTNDLEQYTRNWCLRFIGLSVSPEMETNIGNVNAAILTVWNRVIAPILRQVVSDGRFGLTELPDMKTVIENGHKLGSGKGLLPPPLIIRFTRREYRDMIIRNRKFAPAPSDAEVTAGVSKIRIVEDLTHVNHQRLQDLIKDDRISSAWTIQGKFRYILKDDSKKEIIHCRGSTFNIDESVAKLNMQS